MRKTNIYDSDRLVELDNGSYEYHDTYGDVECIPDLESLYAWASDNGIEISDELKQWIEDAD